MNVNKISIVTLTYKNSHLLYKSISSVANQIFNESYQVEYLIVDDCSDDFDKDFVVNILRKTNLNYRVIVNAYNMGTVASFNNAIKLSTGDIIIPLSADDEFYDNNVVNDIVQEFSFKKCQVLTGYRVLKSEDGEIERFPKEKVVNIFNDRNLLLKYIKLRGNIISGASTYYARFIFEEFGFFDERYRLLEDYPFYLKVLSNGGNISLFKRNVIIYGDDGVSSSKKINPLLKNDYDILYN
ncbi:glycosyltransferase, partial [Aeromonas media]